MKRLLIFSVVFISLLVWAIYSGWLFFNYPSEDKYPIRGIDISHHNGVVNWRELSKEKLAFVYIKATQGRDFVDTLYRANADSAAAYGYAVGSYHYYSICKTAAQQVSNFIAHVPYRASDLPPVLDVEYGETCKGRISDAVLIEEIQIFLDTLEAYYHKRPIIYTTASFYEDNLTTGF